MRTRTLVLLSALVTVPAVAVTTLVSDPSAAPSVAPHGVRRESAVVASEPVAHRATVVLHAWDRRRAAAWARADLDALAALYEPGSPAGRRDVAMLRAYRSRGLRVRGLARQVLRVRAESGSAGTLRLTVTDRLAAGVVTGRGVRVALPVGGWATRRIVLRRVGGAWVVAEVRPQPAR